MDLVKKKETLRELIRPTSVLSAANTNDLTSNIPYKVVSENTTLATVIVRILSAALVGMASGQSFCGLGVYAIFPILWGMAHTRREAFGLSMAFYLTSARGVFAGAPIFFGDEGFYKLSGLLLWLSTSISLSAPWTLLWSKDCTIVSKPSASR